VPLSSSSSSTALFATESGGSSNEDGDGENNNTKRSSGSRKKKGKKKKNEAPASKKSGRWFSWFFRPRQQQPADIDKKSDNEEASTVEIEIELKNASETGDGSTVASSANSTAASTNTTTSDMNDDDDGDKNDRQGVETTSSGKNGKKSGGKAASTFHPKFQPELSSSQSRSGGGVADEGENEKPAETNELEQEAGDSEEDQHQIEDVNAGKNRRRRRRRKETDAKKEEIAVVVKSTKKPPSLPSEGGLLRRVRRKVIKLVTRVIQLGALVGAILVASPYVTSEIEDVVQERILPHFRPSSSTTTAGGEGREGSAKEMPESGALVPIAKTSDKEEGEVDRVISDHSTNMKEESGTSTIVKEEPKQTEDSGGVSSSTERIGSPLALQKPSDRAADSKQRESLEERQRKAVSFVTEAVERIGPSVVRIDTETRFLQDEAEEGIVPAHPQTPGFVQQGQGSGLIFSKDGYVLTNAHVVEDATKVTVTLTDGRVYQAEVKGVDEIVDIAVLKILPQDSSHGKSSSSSSSTPIPRLPVADLGDSDKLTVGQLVVAVGSPGGLDNTVTMGIVSGLERSSAVVGIPHKKVDYIQTDAAINVSIAVAACLYSKRMVHLTALLFVFCSYAK